MVNADEERLLILPDTSFILREKQAFWTVHLLESTFQEVLEEAEQQKREPAPTEAQGMCSQPSLASVGTRHTCGTYTYIQVRHLYT